MSGIRKVEGHYEVPLPLKNSEIRLQFLWDLWAYYSTFENVLLMYTLEGVSSVANFITAYEESQ